MFHLQKRRRPGPKHQNSKNLGERGGRESKRDLPHTQQRCGGTLSLNSAGNKLRVEEVKQGKMRGQGEQRQKSKPLKNPVLEKEKGEELLGRIREKTKKDEIIRGIGVKRTGKSWEEPIIKVMEIEGDGEPTDPISRRELIEMIPVLTKNYSREENKKTNRHYTSRSMRKRNSSIGEKLKEELIAATNHIRMGEDKKRIILYNKGEKLLGDINTEKKMVRIPERYEKKLIELTKKMKVLTNFTKEVIETTNEKFMKEGKRMMIKITNGEEIKRILNKIEKEFLTMGDENVRQRIHRKLKDTHTVEIDSNGYYRVKNNEGESLFSLNMGGYWKLFSQKKGNGSKRPRIWVVERGRLDSVFSRGGKIRNPVVGRKMGERLKEKIRERGNNRERKNENNRSSHPLNRKAA